MSGNERNLSKERTVLILLIVNPQEECGQYEIYPSNVITYFRQTDCFETFSQLVLQEMYGD